MSTSNFGHWPKAEKEWNFKFAKFYSPYLVQFWVKEEKERVKREFVYFFGQSQILRVCPIWVKWGKLGQFFGIDRNPKITHKRGKRELSSFKFTLFYLQSVSANFFRKGEKGSNFPCWVNCQLHLFYRKRRFFPFFCLHRQIMGFNPPPLSPPTIGW